MMPHHILEKALELKVFQMWELVHELEKDWGFLLTEKQIKDRVRTWIERSLGTGFLIKVADSPPLFAVKRYKKDWQAHLRKRTCPVCGKEFVPAQHTQELCSPGCKREHYKRYHRERRKKLGMKLDSKRRWTPEEVRTAIALRELGKSYKEIALILGRTPEGVKDKLKRSSQHEAQNDPQ